MKKAVEAGREAFLAGRMPKKLYSANPSSPNEGVIASSSPASGLIPPKQSAAGG
jgi:thiazole synthase